MTLSLGLLFLIGILALSCLSTTSIFNQQQQDLALAQPYVQTSNQKAVAQKTTSPSPTSSVIDNTTLANKGHLSMALLNQIKPMILKSMGNKSKGGESIVVGVITRNGTSVSGYGNISKANTTKVNGDSIFDIGSVTKMFTTTLLATTIGVIIHEYSCGIKRETAKFTPS